MQARVKARAETRVKIRVQTRVKTRVRLRPLRLPSECKESVVANVYGDGEWEGRAVLKRTKCLRFLRLVD